MSYTYKKRPLDQPGFIRSDGTIVLPGDTSAWREYLQWMYSGGIADEADEIVIPPQLMSKREIWDRMTDAEIEAVHIAREGWPLRYRLMWDDATDNRVNPDDPLLIEFLDGVIGPDRRRSVLG